VRVLISLDQLPNDAAALSRGSSRELRPPRRRGIRQSIPSSNMPSCAGVITTFPSAGDGQTSDPFPAAWRTGRGLDYPTTAHLQQVAAATAKDEQVRAPPLELETG